MFDSEIVDWIKKEKIKLPPNDTRAVYEYNSDYRVNICNLNILGCEDMWMVTLETHFIDDDIEIWNGFVINNNKEILDYDNGRTD